MLDAIEKVIQFREAINSIPKLTITHSYQEITETSIGRSPRNYESDSYRNKTSVNG